MSFAIANCYYDSCEAPQFLYFNRVRDCSVECVQLETLN